MVADMNQTPGNGETLDSLNINLPGWTLTFKDGYGNRLGKPSEVLGRWGIEFDPQITSGLYVFTRKNSIGDVRDALAKLDELQLYPLWKCEDPVVEDARTAAVLLLNLEQHGEMGHHWLLQALDDKLKTSIDDLKVPDFDYPIKSKPGDVRFTKDVANLVNAHVIARFLEAEKVAATYGKEIIKVEERSPNTKGGCFLALKQVGQRGMIETFARSRNNVILPKKFQGQAFWYADFSFLAEAERVKSQSYESGSVKLSRTFLDPSTKRLRVTEAFFSPFKEDDIAEAVEICRTLVDDGLDFSEALKTTHALL